MKSFTYTVQDELGIHARPAGLLAKTAGAYKSVVMIDNGTKKVDAKRLMAIMSMGVKKGTTVAVTVEGEDEDAAASAIEEFFRTNF
ncbi:MAG: HPr family phosphocarrier protein [Lachnospiraceae bacterium]|nr:HPr family phosphocarrier protein [Lachnospiraceae bacterium]